MKKVELLLPDDADVISVAVNNGNGKLYAENFYVNEHGFVDEFGESINVFDLTTLQNSLSVV